MKISDKGMQFRPSKAFSFKHRRCHSVG